MTSPEPRVPRSAADGHDAARWEEAARVRRDHPGWVVIWSRLHGEFRARPLFRAPPGTIAAATTPDGLIAQIDEIENARPSRARPGGPGSPEQERPPS
ncbi:MAG: hypothetical protein ACLQDY_08235 [Streptosporangiaceae bacterium]